MRPLIVLTTSTYTAADYRVPQVALGTTYISVVESMGGSSILTTPAHDTESLDHIMEMAQGLILTGGEDVEPGRYGQKPHPKLGSTNPARDEMEFRVLEVALRRQIPVLAICRGLQLLNVALGGTLYQDLPSQLDGDLLHEQSAPIGDRWHRARVEKDSRLAGIFGATELFINSFHHQGIDKLAPELEPLVWAEDELIEGVEAPGYPWVFGVQWHPERGEAEMDGDRRHPDRRLFWSFMEAARERQTSLVEV